MSKGVMKTKPKATKPNEVQRSVEPHANLSILELMDGITSTTEELQDVIRRIEDEKEDSAEWKHDVEYAYNNYLEQKAGYEEHLKKVDQLVHKKKFLSTELASYSDAFKNRMD